LAPTAGWSAQDSFTPCRSRYDANRRIKILRITHSFTLCVLRWTSLDITLGVTQRAKDFSVSPKYPHVVSGISSTSFIRDTFSMGVGVLCFRDP
jgi:hypothetical protein